MGERAWSRIRAAAQRGELRLISGTSREKANHFLSLYTEHIKYLDYPRLNASEKELGGGVTSVTTHAYMRPMK